MLTQKPSRDACGVGGDLIRSALGDDSAALVASARAEVDDIVAACDDVEVMLDDDDGGAEIEQALEDAEKSACVERVQAYRRLVENKDAVILPCAHLR